MTVPFIEDPRVEYTATASQTSFTYNFLLTAQNNLVVTVDGNKLSPGVGFTVTGLNNVSGGNFVLTTALTAGQLVVAYRDTRAERITDFQPNGPLTAESLNNALDVQVIISQDTEALSKVGHIRLSPDQTGANVNAISETVEQRAGKYLGFDISGNPVALDTVGVNRGAWAALTSYQQNDIVRDETTLNVYQANTAFTSGSTFVLSNWTLLFDATVRRITETVVTKSASFTPDLAAGTIFELTATGTVTMPTTGEGKSFTVIVSSGNQITWAGSPQWTSGQEPAKGTGRDVYTFLSIGSTWLGGQVGTNFAT